MTVTKNGHLACPPSRRGHAWRELRSPDLAALRVCRRCGEIGRINEQGIVVATGDRINQDLRDAL
jgi:hypothetical protein